MIEMREPGRVEVLWQKARVLSIERNTSSIKSFVFEPERPFGFYPGQHVDVRLTADNGYVAMRSYSIASSSVDFPNIQLAIERLDEGEVSPFFHDILTVGDEIELRGPLGGHFILRPEDQGPILLIGGGSGVVPLVSMVRSQKSGRMPIALLVSARTWDDILFREELVALQSSETTLQVAFALTRDSPRRTTDYGRRVDASMLEDLLMRLPGKALRAYICGSNPFVNSAADSAIAAGLSPREIRTERYGG